MSWVAVASAVLGRRGDAGVFPGVEVVVLPVTPAAPVGLAGGHADLWLRLVDGPVADEDMNEDERAVVLEYARAGIASDDVDSEYRISSLDAPWLSSPLHELVNGLIARICQQQVIDAVIIKGPALHRQGLRAREHSGDIDVWVSAQRIADLTKQLESWGWRRLNERWENSPLYHSVTLVPGAWGCEIDLHRHMPGFALSDHDSLRALRRSAETIEYAGISAPVPRRGAHAVISALHLMRPQQGRPIHAGNREQAITALTLGGQDALTFAKEVGAGPALGEVLTCAFPGEADATRGPVPLNWSWRAEPDRLKRYVIMFRATPLRSWPRMAFRSVWPEEHIALSLDRMYGGGATSPLAARLRRLRRGVRQQVRMWR